MRNFLNTILQFIGAATLTDAEFDSLDIDLYGWDKPTYSALAEVLGTREGVSVMQERLKLAFLARGVDVNGLEPKGKSNILIGVPIS